MFYHFYHCYPEFCYFIYYPPESRSTVGRILYFIHAFVLNLPLDGILINHFYSVPARYFILFYLFFCIFPHFDDFFGVEIILNFSNKKKPPRPPPKSSLAKAQILHRSQII